MKRFNCLFAVLAAALFGLLPLLPLHAEPVGAERALAAARAFFRNDANRALQYAPLQPVNLYSAPSSRAGEEQPDYYVFNRAGGGFVLIAGDDGCRPVLGYSFTDRFDTGTDMPDNLREWLGEIERQVAFARRVPQLVQRQDAEWASLSAATKGGGSYRPAVLLDTPLWNQREPFNNLAPMVGDKRAVIGCVGLAMGMLMRFYGFPLRGEGTLSGYSYTMDDGTVCNIPGYDLGYDYAWDKIKYSYETYTQEEGDAVARLVYDCAVSAQAKFDAATSARTQEMAASAVTYFGFDPGACYYKRELFTDEMWMDMLKGELQEHPVLYSARRDGGGHAFLVDGYDDQDLLHVNWGWGGKNNGYYALSGFKPRADAEYVFSHAAIFGLKPKEGAGGESRTYLYYQAGISSSGVEYNGLTPLADIRPGGSFDLRAGFLYNGGLSVFSGEYFIALVDPSGQVKEDLSGVRTIEPLNMGSGRGFSGISCTLNAYPMEGDRVILLYRSDTWPEGRWECPVYDTGSDIVAEIAVTDDTRLEAVTSLWYNKSDGAVTVNTKDRVDWSLRDASGKSLSDAVSYTGTTLVIQTAEMPKGSYVLTLKRGDEQCILNLKMGKK